MVVSITQESSSAQNHKWNSRKLGIAEAEMEEFSLPELLVIMQRLLAFELLTISYTVPEYSNRVLVFLVANTRVIYNAYANIYTYRNSIKCCLLFLSEYYTIIKSTPEKLLDHHSTP